MSFRFIIVDDDNYSLMGTDNEALAREWAQDVLVYDTQTGMSLNGNGTDDDIPLSECHIAPDGGPFSDPDEEDDDSSDEE